MVSGGPRPLRLLVFDDANPANARGLLRSGSRGRSGVDVGCIRRRSYIPAIEEHINSLTADREIASAIEAAPFVIDNLNAQIGAFRNVLDTMRAGLDRLDGEQRDQVEQASAVLRKARAGARLPLEDISRRKESQ